MFRFLFNRHGKPTNNKPKAKAQRRRSSSTSEYDELVVAANAAAAAAAAARSGNNNATHHKPTTSKKSTTTTNHHPVSTEARQSPKAAKVPAVAAPKKAVAAAPSPPASPRKAARPASPKKITASPTSPTKAVVAVSPKKAATPPASPAKAVAATAPPNGKPLPPLYQGRVWNVTDPIPYEPISCDAVNVKSVTHVMACWDKVVQIPNWEEVAGKLLLRKMFEVEEAFRVQFGFTKDADWNDAKVYENKMFVMHGVALVIAVDKAIHFLGPDLEPLEKDLHDLGRRHIHMGAKPEYWPLVGEALFYTLEAALGDDFTLAVRDSWTLVYHFLAYHMIQGLLQELSERSGGVTVRPSPPPMQLPQPKPVVEPAAPVVTTVVKKKKPLPELYRGRVWSLNDPIPYTKVNCDAVNFSQVSDVIASWNKVVQIPNWEGIAGELLLRKMFEIEEAFRVQFGFTKEADWNDPRIYENKMFVMHGVALVIAVDKAIQFLGPDLEPLEQDLHDLGRRHIHMGAKPEYWPLVGDALFYTLEAALGEDFTPRVQESWSVVYHFLAYHMIQGLLAELSERS